MSINMEVLVDETAGSDHYAAFDNTGTSDFVCACGLPWWPSEGCAYLRGARAMFDVWISNTSLPR